MERTDHIVRLMGPYSPEDDARADAERMAKIQTDAWADWLAEKGVSRNVIESTLWSDTADEQHMETRELRLREAFGRTGDNEAVLYFGAYAQNGDMVGFSKFMMFEENDAFVILLAEIDVLPDYQGKNSEDPLEHHLAKKMMYSALANVQGENTYVRLQVLLGNERARRLYQRLGFITSDTNGTFPFEDAAGDVVHSEPHWTMEAPAIEVRDNLRRELEL